MDPLRRATPAQRFALARQLRLNPTPAEGMLGRCYGIAGILRLKFRRQHVLHGFIVDFYCIARRIVLEAEFLRAAGYRVLRLKNCDVTRSRLEELLKSVLDTHT